MDLRIVHPTDVPSAEIGLAEEEGVLVCRVRAVSETPFDGDCALRVGIALPDAARWMADYRYSPYWCRPAFGEALGDVPPRTQCLLWEKADGGWGAILPLSAGEVTTTLAGHEGKLTAVVQSFTDSLTEIETIAFVAAESVSPWAALQRLARAACRLLGNGLKLRRERKYPEIFEYLGWCSWDSMEIWVNEAETLQKCDEFAAKGIPVRWGILDDMWADIAWTEKLPRFTDHSISFKVMHSSKMRDYEADPERFPHGLAHCIAEMNRRGMKVGIWHPINGYWAGLAPDSPAAEKLADCTMTVSANGQILPDLRTPETAKAYYNRLHSFFADCGAEFVKIDNQSALPAKYKNAVPIGTAARNLHVGIEDSVKRHFDGALINCMCMGNENMFNRPETAITRCSDDFKPEDSAWFAKHLMQCAYNGLVQGLFCTCDWDMWWSDDAQAGKNSLLRALSGGPIYVSDRLARSRAEIFAPLCFADGRILRPDGVAVPTKNWLVRNPVTTPEAMTVFNYVGETTYVAAFHITDIDAPVPGALTMADLALPPAEQYLLYAHFNGEWRVMNREETYTFILTDHSDYRLFSITPIRDGMAVLGDVRKFIAIRAVAEAAEGIIRTVEGGTISFWHAVPITAVTAADGASLPFTRDGELYTVESGQADEIRYY